MALPDKSEKLRHTKSSQANTMIPVQVNKEGNFRIAVDKHGETEISIKVKFGKEYFFKCDVLGGFLNTKITIDQVPVALGREESGVLSKE